MRSGPRSCICMIVCIGLGLSRYKQNDGEDDQINCLSILNRNKGLICEPSQIALKHLPERPKRTAELQTPSCGLCLREGRKSGGMEACG